MKRNLIPYAGFCLLAMLSWACNENELEEFREEPAEPVELSAGNLIDQTVANEAVEVEWEILLSGPAQRAFEVSVALAMDTVYELIENGTLENTVALPLNSILLPTHLNVPYGVDRASLTITIDRTFIERLFGEKVALGIRLVSAGKGNRIVQRASVLVLNTADLLTEDELHYVSFGLGGGGVLPVGNRLNYNGTSAGIQVPLNISLNGSPGRSFTVKAVLNPDTIPGLIETEVLPANSKLLRRGDYTLDTLITVGGNRSSAPLNLTVPWAVLQANLDSVLVLALDLAEPSRHLLHPENSRVIVKIEPVNVVETDVTNQGAFSVSRDNSNVNENSPKVIDGTDQTKFLQPSFSGDLWMELEFPEPMKIGAYILTSANDAPERDPKDWVLRASHDGATWVDLDRRSNEEFSQRFQAKRYDFSNNTAYKYYRLYITANRGANLFQMAEWRMIRVP